ncbi:MAG: hypothetical protein RL026_504 [Pseudomonadota bacterium]|jgi:UDP-N-acetylmuramoyl-L-alanyl-D-glutamate--2,6-diaminopimelate ligase
MKLSALLTDTTLPDDPDITDLAIDSREVAPGSLFLACRGGRGHGLDHLAQALAAGARAVLWEPEDGRPAPELPPTVVGLPWPGLRDQAGEIADRFFGHPSRRMAVVGITGTNGKTTTAWLLAQALRAAGRPAAYVGTLGAAFDGELQPGTHTTPDAVNLQRQLAAFAARGAACVALEVSSHALDQGRTAGVHFDAAVFTNLSRDHLDYHGSMAAYGAAKARLFASDALRLAVVNVDDGFGRTLLAKCAAPQRMAVARQQVPEPGKAATWLRAGPARTTPGGLAFTLDSSFGTTEVSAPLVGDFNIDNLLAVLAVLLGSGLGIAQAVAAVSSVSAPPGRLEAFGGGDLPLVVVDYAHTPDALAKVLAALRAQGTGRLLCVFGCGGERDAGKRPQMGRIAAEGADLVVLTDDNPRGEASASILAAIRAGIPASTPLQVVPDRALAIETALAEARAGDIVLVAGKGHENWQIIGAERRPFSDQAVVAQALARRSAA